MSSVLVKELIARGAGDCDLRPCHEAVEAAATRAYAGATIEELYGFLRLRFE